MLAIRCVGFVPQKTRTIARANTSQRSLKHNGGKTRRFTEGLTSRVAPVLQNRLGNSDFSETWMTKNRLQIPKRLQGPIGLLLGLLMLTSPLLARDRDVPADVQAAILRRVFEYVTTFENDQPTLLVVQANATDAASKELTEAFEKAGFSPTTVGIDDLDAQIRSASAVYVLPGVPSSQVKQLCIANSVLSLSAEASFVEQGDVSVGIALKKNGRPEILVNMNQVRTEGVPAKRTSLASRETFSTRSN